MNLIYQCFRPECRFRFPTTNRADEQIRCPRCGGPTRLVVLPYEGVNTSALREISSPRIEVLLDNIRSALNVGSIFRTADGVGIDHLHLCGITPTPDHPKVSKTALGAECTVNWSQHWEGVEAAKTMRDRGDYLIALEGAIDSRSLFDFFSAPQDSSIALVVGNEVSGVDPGILELCHTKLHIPMQGSKRSLNVAVAFGITAYHLRFGRAGCREN
ncbi:MAG: RNA methyltransferase [Anaerolineaceae bacterium]|nr:RNA methyltransferase [Anaerolineaceae bacterium]